MATHAADDSWGGMERFRREALNEQSCFIERGDSPTANAWEELTMQADDCGPRVTLCTQDECSPKPDWATDALLAYCTVCLADDPRASAAPRVDGSSSVPTTMVRFLFSFTRGGFRFFDDSASGASQGVSDDSSTELFESLHALLWKNCPGYSNVFERDLARAVPESCQGEEEY